MARKRAWRFLHIWMIAGVMSLGVPLPSVLDGFGISDAAAAGQNKKKRRTDTIEGVKSPDPDGAAMLRIARSLEERGELNSAARLYGRAMELRPKDPAPIRALAALFARVGRKAQAQRYYQAALALEPTDQDAALELGKLYLADGLADRAYAVLLPFETTRDDRIFNALGVSLDLLGESDRAREMYGEALALKPDDMAIQNNLALSFAVTSDFYTSWEILLKSINDPTIGTRARTNLAAVYALSGRLQLAMKMLPPTSNANIQAERRQFYTALNNLPQEYRAHALFLGTMPDPIALKDARERQERLAELDRQAEAVRQIEAQQELRRQRALAEAEAAREKAATEARQRQESDLTLVVGAIPPTFADETKTAQPSEKAAQAIRNYDIAEGPVPEEITLIDTAQPQDDPLTEAPPRNATGTEDTVAVVTREPVKTEALPDLTQDEEKPVADNVAAAEETLSHAEPDDLATDLGATVAAAFRTTMNERLPEADDIGETEPSPQPETAGEDVAADAKVESQVDDEIALRLPEEPASAVTGADNEADGANKVEEATDDSVTAAVVIAAATELPAADLPAETKAVEERPPVYRVQLGSYLSPRRAALGWDTFEERYGDIFAGLEAGIAHIEREDADDLYRVYIGRYDIRDDASSLCALVIEKEGSCVVIRSTLPLRHLTEN